MGQQATIKLPDPLNTARTDAAALASADDLLSQLAGEEIDRLLAEADAERPPLNSAPADRAPAGPTAPVSPPATIKPTAAPTAPPTVAHKTPATRTAAPSPSTPAAAAPAPTAPSPVDASMSSDLDALFEQIEKTPDSPPPAAATAAIDVDGDASADPAEASDAQTDAATESHAASAPEDDDASSDVDERVDEPETVAEVAANEIDAATSATDAAPPAATTTIADLATGAAEAAALRDGVDPEDPAAEFLLDDDEDYAPPSVLVRALEMLNAPFAALPESFRDALGKIAVLTLFNAIAVIVYVVLFRK